MWKTGKNSGTNATAARFVPWECAFLDEQNATTTSSNRVRGHSACRAAADHDDVIVLQ
jgi:hypothetical protein